MPPRPLVLSPATPSELIALIIAQHRYPTTLLVGFSKAQFLQGLIQDVHSQQQRLDEQHTSSSQPDAEAQAQTQAQTHADGDVHDQPPSQPQAPDEEQDHAQLEPHCDHGLTQHPLLRAPLMQVAISRHIRLVFTPTVAHLRAYLSAFSPADSRIPPPPNFKPSAEPPLLIAYGFLELHRDASEWSAQGLGISAAALIEAAVAASFRPAIVEPRGAANHDRLEQFLDQNVPLLSGTEVRDDGTWSGRAVPIRRVLRRWFEFQQTEDDRSP